MKNRQLLAIAVAGAMSVHAHAQTTEEQTAKGGAPATSPETELDMIQVVGQATSGIDDVITLEQLENTQANDLNDIFSLNPEISAGGGVALSQKVYVRNVGEDMLNISVDGAEQAGAVFHHAGRVVIEPDLLKQVEVEAGAGSATAGFGALGGAVRFVTKDPEDLLRGDESAGATLKSTYYSNGESTKHSATAYAADQKGMFSGLVNYISADLNNRDDGSGDEIVGSESENQVLFVKGVANISEQQKLSLSYESLTQEGDIAYKTEWRANEDLTTPTWSWNFPVDTKAERDTIILNYALESGNPLLNLSLNAYTTEVTHSREHPVWGEVAGEVETQALTLENTSEFGASKLIYGLNYREDNAALKSLGKEDGEVRGAYVQSILKIGERTTVSTGARYDDYSLNDVNGEEISHDGFAPNLSANYAITSEIGISAGYAEAVRGATVKDSYLLEEGGKYFNDPDLKVERAKNIEVALDYQSGPITAALGAYQATIEDAIVSSVPWKEDMTNSDEDIKSEGYFAKLAYAQDNLNVSTSLHTSETEQDGTPVIRYLQGSSAASIGDTLVVDANYQINSAWYVGWTGQVVDDIDPFTVNIGGQDIEVDKQGYSTHDLYVRWSPMLNEMLVFNLAVKNVFDESYLNHASPEDLTDNQDYDGVAGNLDPGRDIRISAALKF